MRILALVHRVPYPPNKGEKIRAFNELKFLSDRGHAIDLATFADVEEDLGWGEALKKYCRDVAIVPKDRRLCRARSVLALPRGRPLSVGYFDSYRLRRKVDAWLAEREYDLAFCYSSPMAEYVRGKRARGKRMARVMDFVDVDSDKWRQYAAHTKQPMRSVYLFEARALSAYERAIAEEVDASIFVSAAEAEVFRRSAPGARRVVDVPNGVDADYFGATQRRPRDGSAPLLVFVGQMNLVSAVGRLPSLEERIAVKALVRSFTVEETAEYVRHRLTAAGASREIFTPDGIEALHYLGHGVARQINRLADLALLVGYADELPRLAAAQIEAVSEELVTIGAE